MTFKEQLLKEFPWLYEENIAETIKEKCPSELGFISRKAESKLCDEVHCDCKKCWNSEKAKEEVDMSIVVDKYHEGYNKGLEDAWELANKIWDEMGIHERDDVFGFEKAHDVMKHLTPQEALAKLKAYEDSKIEVGDVVKYGDSEVLITNIHEQYFDGVQLSNNNMQGNFGDHYTSRLLKTCKKTGKHIDITSILENISEV